MNPEFRRQLWLRMSAERMFATAVVVGLVFIMNGVSKDWNRNSAAGWALTLATGLSGLLGGAAAIESIAAETRARTWDWQRLSALGPWSMTWGKLLGSALAANCSACFPYLVFLAIGGVGQARVSPPLIVMFGLLSGVLVQSAGMLAATGQLVRGKPQVSLAGASYALAALGSGLMLLFMVQLADTADYEPVVTIRWYGYAVSHALFAFASAAAFLACSVLATYRLLHLELVRRSAPWGSLLCALFIACYLTGLVQELPETSVLARSADRMPIAQMTITGFAYAACLTAGMQRVELTRWLLALRSGWRAAWSLTPAWVACTALSLVSAAVLAPLSAQAVAQSTQPHMQQRAPLIVALSLLAVRDAGLLLALRLRGGALAGDGWLIALLACIHVIVPWTLTGAGAGWLHALLTIHTHQGWLSVVAIACEVVGVGMLVRSQLRRQG